MCCLPQLVCTCGLLALLLLFINDPTNRKATTKPRLMRGIGSGAASLQFARDLAEVYGSEVIRKLGPGSLWGVAPFQQASPLPRKAHAVMAWRTPERKECNKVYPVPYTQSVFSHRVYQGMLENSIFMEVPKSVPRVWIASLTSSLCL